MKNIKLLIISGVTFGILILAVWMFYGTDSLIAEESQIEISNQNKLCVKHQASLAECFYCDASLRDPGRLWCTEHERYEDRCFLCHPELKEANRLWCEEHNLYEDECIFCHPELKEIQNQSLIKKDEYSDAIPKNDLLLDALQCLEHDVLEKECGICHPDLIETIRVGQGLKIRLESSNSAAKAGVITDLPAFGESIPEIVLMGELSYNQNLLARITPLVGGVVHRVFADVGNDVEQGSVLLEISSPEVALAKSEYLNVIADETLKKLAFEREKDLIEKRVSALQEYEQAQTEYNMARNRTRRAHQHLLNYGYTEEEIQEIVNDYSSSSYLPIRAPFSGRLIENNTVIGEAIERGDVLFSVTDLSMMWLELSIPEDKIGLIGLGDRVEVQFDAIPRLSFEGQLSWISTSIDDQTRNIRARAELSNDNLILKHGMFGKVKLLSKRSMPGLIVPVEALQNLDGIPVVFVKLEDDLYEARKVTLGGKNKNLVEVLGGILSGEEVVVAHSYTLKSEFLKSRLGAGCVDD